MGSIRFRGATARRNLALCGRGELIVGRSEMRLRRSNASLQLSVAHLPWIGAEEVDRTGR